ncbi:uncharacterized protein LOC103314865 [Tribolium castaneum]|uniref:Uncharacterized protein n=1 Tax=Tribolium castaneum TaxID=7070 RepID=A0A139W8B1_TRICA|nr:PREDICTED: uncharacterized protein LOC103314865 [Tribolium castaneum]KXZ75519.1 hypothetical protein TcasGA2_TC031753 [Tribolium castaneum]|eukprot:XP_008200205.1 PREDICTED: uncharacterized protein LOC103314865 [Tribolium castaneum]
MTPHCIKVLVLLAIVALPRTEALFSRPPFAPSPIHFHLEDDGPPFIPKYSSLKFFSPSSVSSDKFPSWKKPPKYLVGKLPDWKVPDFVDDEKNLKEVVLEEPFRPVSFDFNSLAKSKHRFDDVKPVTEHIEGDLKYDFRTKTHSI